MTLDGNVVEDNTGSYQAGIRLVVSSGSEAVLVNNMIHANTTGSTPGGGAHGRVRIKPAP